MYSKPWLRERAVDLMREFPLMSDREIAREIGVANKSVSRWRAEAGVPRAMPPGLTTEEVIARAADAGVVLTARRLLRWLELGLLPSWAGARLFPGHGSVTYWWPGIVEQAVEIDRLLRRHRKARDAVLSLVAAGYAVDDDVAQRMYLAFLRAVRQHDLLVPHLAASKRGQARLRRRTLWGWRSWLDATAAERGLAAMSAEARRNQRDGLPGPTYKRDIFNDQIEGSRRILQGTLSRWARRDDFLNAIVEPPPPELLAELHRRLSFNALRRAIAGTDTASLHSAAVGLGAVFLRLSDVVLERAERDDFNLFGDITQTREWHALYHEILLADPLIPARLVPFFLALHDSDELEPVLGPILVEVGLRFPDWRAMTLALITWPNLAWGSWHG